VPQRVYSARADIDAPPEIVWAVLTDLDRYREWNPFTPEVRTSFRVGEPIDMRVKMSRLGIQLSQREEIREVQPAARLRYGMTTLAPWLLRAERVQTLEPLPGARTRYTTDDTIGGALSPIVFAIFGSSLEDGFASMTRALAEEAERRVRG
jgi:hypothetical protein